MAYFVLFLFFTFYFGAHWLVYCFFVCILDCRKDIQKYYLKLILTFLAPSFIVAFSISHSWDNIFTKIFYIASGLWVGLLINLVLFISAFGLLYFIFKLFKKDFNKKVYSRIFLALAIVYSLYGIFNVFNLKVREVNVKIEKLPDAWQGKKIVLLSDMHLGRVLGDNFLDMVITKVNIAKPDLVVITGDLFDATDGHLDRFSSALNTIQSEKGIYYITGNHEIYLGPEEITEAINKTDIKFLNDEIAVIDGLQLIGVNYPGFTENKNISELIKADPKFNMDQPSILLFHSPTSILPNGSNNHADVYFNPDMDFKGARDLGIDLQLSGHTHRGQLFPFNFITKIIFKGHDYGLQEVGNFNIYTTSGTGVWGPTMRTSGRSEIVVIELEKR